jgi:hypothetical protein
MPQTAFGGRSDSSGFTLNPEKLTGPLDEQVIDSLPEKGTEVAAVEGEQDIGASQCGAKDRLVLRHIENQRPVEG